MGNSTSKNEHDNYNTMRRPASRTCFIVKEDGTRKLVSYYEDSVKNNHEAYKIANETRAQDLHHKFDKSHNLTCNVTVNIQNPKFMTRTCIDKEKHNNENQTIYVKNKSAIEVTALSKISTKDNSIRNNDKAYKTITETRAQDLFHHSDKSHNLICNVTINAQPKLITGTYVNKEKHNNENQTIYMKNKSAIEVSALSKIYTKDDFMMQWFSWKNEFLTYMKSIDQAENNKEKWGIMLLNRMGPVGQEIHRNFTFDEDHAEGNIDALLKKFDIYCTFLNRKRGDNEDIDKYVYYLKGMAAYMTNRDEIIKEKILMEIDKGRFTRKAESLILRFSFPSCKQSLTLKEMTYIWMSYEDANFKQSEEIHNFLIKNCNNCGRSHHINNCYARGKQCNECGHENHYSMRCPSQFIANCSSCGEGHFIRKCPAYLNKCNRCNRMNHFSWKCRILNCNYCDSKHIASKSACPAKNTICTKCYKRGHFPIKCFKK